MQVTCTYGGEKPLYNHLPVMVVTKGDWTKTFCALYSLSIQGDQYLGISQLLSYKDV